MAVGGGKGGTPTGGSQGAKPSMSPPTQSGALTAPNMAGNIPYYMGGQFNQRPPIGTNFANMLQNMASQGMSQQPFGMQGPPPQDAFAQMQQQQGMMGGMPTGPLSNAPQMPMQQGAPLGGAPLSNTPQMPFTQAGAQQMMPPPGNPVGGLAALGPQGMVPPRPQLDPRQQLRSDVLHDKVQDLKKQYAANPSPELAARIEKVRNKRRDILGREPLVSGAPNSQQVGSEDPRMQAMRKLQTFPARIG